MLDLGRDLPGLPDCSHDPLAHGWRRLGRCGQPKGRSDFLPAADLGCTRLAPAEMPGKPVLLRRVIDRVEHVGAGQGVQIWTRQPHQLTPRQSRRRMSPSRILVLIVPTAAPSNAATSR